jgi:hypothetical protein
VKPMAVAAAAEERESTICWRVMIMILFIVAPRVCYNLCSQSLKICFSINFMSKMTYHVVCMIYGNFVN